MRLESALYTSREGLITSGQAISVIGDNISNSNTTGYKRSRTEFADLVSMGEDHKCEVLKGVGSGAAVNNVRTIFNETGLIEFTGRSLDVGIQGHGFLMVGEATNPMYTRAGNLVMRRDGILITPEGNPVLGYAPGGNTLQNLDMLSLSLNGNITTTSKVFGNLTASDKISTPPNNPATFSEIAKTANFMSNFRVFDSLGEGHDVTIAFTKTGPGAWNAQA